MRKLLLTLGILVICGVAILAGWIFGGRQVSLFIDRFGTIEIASVPIHSIAYEGSGTGGWLTVNDVHLSLDDLNPRIALSIGSTKDNQFAVATGGKVFALGPLVSTTKNGRTNPTAVPPPGRQGSPA